MNSVRPPLARSGGLQRQVARRFPIRVSAELLRQPSMNHGNVPITRDAGKDDTIIDCAICSSAAKSHSAATSRGRSTSRGGRAQARRFAFGHQAAKGGEAAGAPGLILPLLENEGPGAPSAGAGGRCAPRRGVPYLFCRALCRRQRVHVKSRLGRPAILRAHRRSWPRCRAFRCMTHSALQRVYVGFPNADLRFVYFT